MEGVGIKNRSETGRWRPGWGIERESVRTISIILCRPNYEKEDKRIGICRSCCELKEKNIIFVCFGGDNFKLFYVQGQSWDILGLYEKTGEKEELVGG